MRFDLALWEAIRAAGVLAFGLTTLSVVFGLSVRSKVADPVVKRGWVYEFHQSFSVAGLITLITHVALVLLNTHVRFTIPQVLVPFAASWRPWSVAAGILAVYLSVTLVGSSYIRPTLGQKAWRRIHYLSFAAWLLGLAHALTAGTDSHRAWMIWFYALSAQAILVLVVYRLIVTLPIKRTAKVQGRSG